MAGSLFVAVSLLLSCPREAPAADAITAVFDQAPVQDTAMSVIVARVGPDGKPILACVDSKEAARRFLDAPIDRLPGAKKEK